MAFGILGRAEETDWGLSFQECLSKLLLRDFPGGPVVKTPPSNAGGAGLIPSWGAKVPHALWPKNQNIKQKQYCNKFKKDLKNGPHQTKTKTKTKPCCFSYCHYFR